jgi:transcription-repair coupling factor (superfamily II helicase)
MSSISEQIIQKFTSSNSFEQALTRLENTGQEIKVTGLTQSGISVFISSGHQKNQKNWLVIVEDKEAAAYIQNDLARFLGKDEALFYPASYRRPYEIEAIDNANVLLRSEILQQLSKSSKPKVIVTYTDAILEKIITKKDFINQRIDLKIGDKIGLDFINESLFEFGFERTDFVTDPGEFSVRGGIIDVYSFAHDFPYRIEFFGNEVESIRTFDIETQLSKESVNHLTIVPNMNRSEVVRERISFLEYFDSDSTSVFIQEYEVVKKKLDELYAKAEQYFDKLDSPLKHSRPSELFSNSNMLEADLKSHSFVRLEKERSENSIDFKQKGQPAFNKRFDILWKELQVKKEDGYACYLHCSSTPQADRFKEIFAQYQTDLPYTPVIMPLMGGFVDDQAKICCYSDHEIFERYHKFSVRGAAAKKQKLSLAELNKLEVGDYVTHIDHGIGTFGGLQKIEVEGKIQEAIKLIYGDRDILYVSIHSLHKIAKYNGKDGAPPKLYKLGSGAWQKIKEKTKSHVKKVAFDLIEVYAKRRLEKGFQFGPDSYLQHELEASFIYEDTPDQEKATKEVKADMERDRPMDRLVCGDVGFGKTEIAIRAAFKAVDNGKQVAVLVPTTILAFQHANTFSKRLEDLPVRVDFLNRFRTSKEKKEIIEDVKAGKIDILIGTHQIVNKNVKFKDLGLLIVDEEQKFGVSVKERIKSFKASIDVLTLTATPIPRTLQFSLMAARDLSVINTPPPNRYPIESSVIRFDLEAIRDAISYEIQRGGQVYFIHNRIENIKEVAGMIQQIVPDARVRTGHGRMDGKDLEELMLNFMNGNFDVLVSTTIVESGLDIPNANTILIHNAHSFGLSDLHQMRGRVGRSNKKAFCYFITDPFEALTSEARKRMEALAQFTELGSGFQIAMKDLEIRGAGDLLGGQQSGFISDIGFDTYQKIVSEAIEELKNNEFKSLYQEEKDKDEVVAYISEVQVDSDLELLFPDDYINANAERLSLYRELSEVKSTEELNSFTKKLIDRFGPLPQAANDLIQSISLKWIAKSLGIEKIVFKRETLIGYFLSDSQSAFYQSAAFQHLIKVTASLSCAIKEKPSKNGPRLLIRFDHIESLDKATKALQQLQL